MAAPFKPLGKKRALLVAIQHVRCKDGSMFCDFSVLRFAHRDAKAFREHLIDACGYHPDDVILMMDDRDHPEHLWPTRNKILQQMNRLTSDISEDCHICFYFSGHGRKEDGHGHVRASMRADGRHAEIVCADGKPILDYILHDHLITPFERVKGSRLFTLLDCCYSENLLDLRKGNGPNSYSRVWHIGPGQLFIYLATIIVNLLKLRKKCRRKCRNTPPIPPRRASSKWRGPPVPKTEEVGELSIICLSACRDGQEAHDDREQELTFTKCFLDVIKTKPNIAWTELRGTLKELVSKIQARYEEAWLQGLIDETYERRWVQSPRFTTSHRTDLTRKISL